MVRPVEVQEAESLADLAAKANAEHHEGTTFARQSLLRFKVAGEALLKAKERVKYGTWLGWLRKNIKFSGNTARNYMRVAANWDKIHNGCESDLGLRDALKLLGMQEDEKEKEVPEAPKPNAAEQATGVPPEEPAAEEPQAEDASFDGAGLQAIPTSPSDWRTCVSGMERALNHYQLHLSGLMAHERSAPEIRRVSQMLEMSLNPTGEIVDGRKWGSVSYGVMGFTCDEFDRLQKLVGSLKVIFERMRVDPGHSPVSTPTDAYAFGQELADDGIDF